MDFKKRVRFFGSPVAMGVETGINAGKKLKKASFYEDLVEKLPSLSGLEDFDSSWMTESESTNLSIGPDDVFTPVKKFSGRSYSSSNGGCTTVELGHSSPPEIGRFSAVSDSDSSSTIGPVSPSHFSDILESTPSPNIPMQCEPNRRRDDDYVPQIRWEDAEINDNIYLSPESFQAVEVNNNFDMSPKSQKAAGDRKEFRQQAAGNRKEGKEQAAGNRKEGKEQAAGNRKDAIQQAPGNSKDARQQAAGNRKDVRQQAPGNSKDVRQQAPGNSKDVRQQAVGDYKQAEQKAECYRKDARQQNAGYFKQARQQTAGYFKQARQQAAGNSKHARQQAAGNSKQTRQQAAGNRKETRQEAEANNKQARCLPAGRDDYGNHKHAKEQVISLSISVSMIIPPGTSVEFSEKANEFRNFIENSEHAETGDVSTDASSYSSPISRKASRKKKSKLKRKIIRHKVESFSEDSRSVTNFTAFNDRGVIEGDVTGSNVTEGDVTDGGVTEGDVTDGGVTEGDVTDRGVTESQKRTENLEKSKNLSKKHKNRRKRDRNKITQKEIDEYKEHLKTLEICPLSLTKLPLLKYNFFN